jgi:hypothetical protein
MSKHYSASKHLYTLNDSVILLKHRSNQNLLTALHTSLQSNQTKNMILEKVEISNIKGINKIIKIAEKK